MTLRASLAHRRRVPAAALVLAALAAGAAAPGASAQATRTWISGVGDDANPCSRTAPCKTIAGSISKTAAGGEINAIDPGGFGAVTVVKPITVDFSAIGTGGVLNQSTNGVVVNAGPNDDVTLRGLDVFGSNALSGTCTYGGLAAVRVVGGRTIRIEDSTIASQDIGVQLAPTASDLTVLVNRVDVTNACRFGINAVPAAGRTVDVTVRDSTFMNVGTAVAAGVGAHVRLVDSIITGNAVGLDTSGGGLIDAVGDGQVFGNLDDGAPTATLATPRDGAVGPAGPAGPAGAPGPVGATGPQGEPAYRLLVVLPKTRLSVQRGQALAMDYVSTSAAAATLRVKRGSKVVATVRRKARLGRNGILWNGRIGRRAAPVGRYALDLSVVSADGQRGHATARLKVTRPRR